MAIHILNCLDIHPYFTWAKGGVTCMLVETNQGPVLVDTGLGLQEPQTPALRLRLYKWFYRTYEGMEQTAIQRTQEYGYKPKDVQHIILTHAHLDHAGGLADFPWACVHLLQKELDYIHHNPNWKYLPEQWAHQPKWNAHHPIGEQWFNFDAVRLDGFSPEIWLVPLPGHTPGLAGVAIQKDKSWVFYGSDALPYNARIDLVPRWFACYFMYHHAPRIRRLLKKHPEIQLISGHMHQGFYTYQNSLLTKS